MKKPLSRRRLQCGLSDAAALLASAIVAVALLILSAGLFANAAKLNKTIEQKSFGSRLTTDNEPIPVALGGDRFAICRYGRLEVYALDQSGKLQHLDTAYVSNSELVHEPKLPSADKDLTQVH